MDLDRQLELLEAAEGDPAHLALATLEILLASQPAPLRRVLEAAAIPHRCTQDSLRLLLDDDLRPNAVRWFAAVASLPCIESSSGGGISVHEATRLALRRHLFAQNPARFRELALRAANAFSGPAPHDQIEQVYHLLAADPPRAASILRRLSLELVPRVEQSLALAGALDEYTHADLWPPQTRGWAFLLSAWKRDAYRSRADTTSAAAQALEAFSMAEDLWGCALARHVLGDTAMGVGNLAEAERCLQEAHQVFQELTARDPDQPELQRDLAACLDRLGDLALAQGHLALAVARFQACLEIRERLLDHLPANAAWERELTISLNKLGDLAMIRGDLAEAARQFARCLRIREHLAEGEPANTQWQKEISLLLEKLGELANAQTPAPQPSGLPVTPPSADSTESAARGANADRRPTLLRELQRLGETAAAHGDFDKALERYHEARRLARQLLRGNPDNPQWLQELSACSENLDRLEDLRAARGDLNEVAARFDRAFTLCERLATSDPANAGRQRDLAVSLERLGDLATAQRNYAEASRRLAAAHEVARRLADSDPANTDWQRDLAVSFNKLGGLALLQGDLKAAAEWFGQARTISAALAASDPTNVEWQRDFAVSLARLGDLATHRDDFASALTFFQQAIEITERLAALGPAHAEWQRDLAVLHYKRGIVRDKMGDHQAHWDEFRACFTLLRSMQLRGLFFDPQMARVYRDLCTRFLPGPHG